MKKFLLLSVTYIFCTVVAAQKKYSPDWPSLNSREIPVWYKDAKFGIFIHWGLYSVPAWATNSNADGFGSNYAEWYWQRLHAPNLKIHKEFAAFHDSVYGKNFSYQEFAPLFKCELFNPDQWADIIKSSGAKYVVLTSKHHDGFTLWPSKQSWNWNAKDVGPHRDLAGEVAVAVKQKGLQMGFYYSLYEWFNPLYKTNVNRYVDEHMLPQLRDIVNTYKPDIVWADGQWEHSDTVWKSREFLAWLFNESPVKDRVVTNDRWGGGAGNGGFTTTEYGKGTFDPNKTWEECRGIGESFGYNRNENLEQYLSSKQVLHTLIDVVARGGNLLLNIGPAADGTIPVIMQQRLKDIGDWLQVNGEAIYGSTAWSGAAKNTSKQIAFTQKQTNLYAIAKEWVNEFEIKDIPEGVKSVSLLGYSGKVVFKQKGNTVIIKAPAINPGNNPCEFAWVYKIQR